MEIVLKTPFPYILGRSLKVLTKIMPKTKLNPGKYLRMLILSKIACSFQGLCLDFYSKK